MTTLRIAVEEQPQPTYPVSNLSTPGVHVVRIEPHFGDFYAFCSCGAKSLPVADEDALDRWVCPWWDAQQEVERNEQLWQARNADAQVSFVVR